MLRPVAPADTPALLALAAATGAFKPHEVAALREVLDDYHAANHRLGHRAWAWADPHPGGFVYVAPAALTDRTWDVWWLAVAPGRQRHGLGGRLMDAAEGHVWAAGGRLLVLDTSSAPGYDPARRFYLSRGFAAVAAVPDFYADGDAKVIFAKRRPAP